ncbi:MAG: DUF6340 family protein [Draconibacterium sp.]|nr:DUF6340 family protein [Draconibacterium sp.]
MWQSFKININYAVIILLIVFSTSCISTKTLTIEIPRQSKKELPSSIQSLTLVNRTVDDKFTNLDSDSLQQIFYNKNFNTDTVINDIQASDTTIKALGELLFESGRYDFVIPKKRFLNFERNSFLNVEMPWKEVRELCETYNTDAVLSLDHFKMRVATDYEKTSLYDPRNDGFATASYAKMKIYYEALFRVYDPVQEKVLTREFLRDTLVWEDMDYSTRALFDRFTPVKTALSEAGIAIALDFAEEISTVWHEERRNYFPSGDSNLKQAAKFVTNGNWETAMALWNDTAEKTKSKALKSKAELNIAIAYELQGDLNKAISEALKSYNTMYRLVTYNYLEILKGRKNELIKQQR